MRLGGVRRCLCSLHCGDGVSARWAAAPRTVREEDGGVHTEGPAAPRLCEGVGGGGGVGVVSAAPSADPVTSAEKVPACPLRAWGWKMTNMNVTSLKIQEHLRMSG